MPIDDEDDLPGTLQRSPRKAQRTYAKTLESAEETYDDTSRAHRAAWASVKHSFEKVGNRWQAKKEKGPSDPGAKGGGQKTGETFGGVDFYGNTKQELYERARDLGVKGASRMNKADLARAIARKQK